MVRGAAQSRKFSAFYFRQGRLISADCINRFGDHIAVRKLLRASARGYVEAKKDYKAAAEIMEKHMPVKVDRDVLEQQVAATLDSTSDPNRRPVGWQDDAEWASNLNLLKGAGVIKDVKDSQVYYTNQYLR